MSDDGLVARERNGEWFCYPANFKWLGHWQAVGATKEAAESAAIATRGRAPPKIKYANRIVLEIDGREYRYRAIPEICGAWVEVYPWMPFFREDGK